MDPSNQHLIGGVRRAPMNQDEFDTKFNFLSERRTSRRRYSLDSIVVVQHRRAAADLCGAAICWRRAAQRSVSIVSRPQQQVPKQSQQQQHKQSRKHTSLASGNSGSGGASHLPLPRYQLNNADEDAQLWASRNCLSTHFPLIRCLHQYSFRKDLFGDLRAGLALALHGTAEGLAMAFLAGLPPICGLLTVLCSSLLYLFFGTSNFSFMGTNLLVCFLLRNIIERAVPNFSAQSQWQQSTFAEEDLPVQIAITVTFLAATIQTLIYLLRLDFLFSFFSDQMLDGLSLGIGLRVLFLQLGHIIRLKPNRICASELSLREASNAIASQSVPSSTSSFPCVIWAYYRRLSSGGDKLLPGEEGGVQVRQHLPAHHNLSLPWNLSNGSLLQRTRLAQSNPASLMGNSCLPSIWECFDAINLNTLAIAVACTLLLLFTRQIIGPLTRFRLRSAVSSEFLMITLASLLSRALNAEVRWQLETVNFPSNATSAFMLTFPRPSLVGHLFADSLAMALLVYTLHLRTSHSLAKTHKYRLDERQELVALCVINSLSAFAGAFPPGQSSLRTHLGIRAGAKTILANLSLVLLLVPLLLWSNALFQALPVCVLSCILLTGLCPLFSGLARIPLVWSISRLDILTFTFSAFLALFSANLSQALFGSLFFAAGTIVFRAQWPRLQQLVNVTGSGAYYAERDFYGSDLLDESGMSVIRFEAPILFHNAIYFKACVKESYRKIKGQLLGVGIGTRTGSMKSMKSTNAQVMPPLPHNKDSLQMRSTLLISGDFVPNFDTLMGAQSADQSGSITRVLIIDFGSVPYVDAQAITIIRELFEELAEKKCRLLFASVNSTIRSWFKMSGSFEHVPKHYFFPSVHDAVLCAQQMGMIAPSIHMSVSLNGCRDLITLSNTASNHELNNLQSETASAQTASTSTAANAPQTNELATYSIGGGLATPMVGGPNSSASIRPFPQQMDRNDPASMPPSTGLSKLKRQSSPSHGFKTPLKKSNS